MRTLSLSLSPVGSMSELRELSDNEDMLLQLLGNMPEVQQLSRDRENLCVQNEQVARKYRLHGICSTAVLVSTWAGRSL